MDKVFSYSCLVIASVSLGFLTSSSSWATNVLGQSFTPTSVKLPIFSISLIDPDTTKAVPVYLCNVNTVAGCTVDIANQAALVSLFGAIPAVGSTPFPSSVPGVVPPSVTPSNTLTITPKTYQQVSMGNCLNGATSYPMQVSGSVIIGGQTLYTTTGTGSGTDLLTPTAASQGYATVSVSNCATIFNIPGGVTVAAGAAVTLNLLTDVTNLAFGFGSAVQGAQCLSGSSYGLCFNLPPMVPYVGSGTPTIETYRLTNAGDTQGTYGYAELEFFLTPTGGVIGISSRPVYEPNTNSVGQPANSIAPPTATPTGSVCTQSGVTGTCNWKIGPFVSPFKGFALNSDGVTYNLISYSSGSVTAAINNSATDSTLSDVLIAKFTRIATVGGTPTTGALTSNRALFDQGMTDKTVSVAYSAVRTK